MQRTNIIDTPKNVGKEVKLNGWVDTVRKHGKVLFVDLRDRSGKCQVVFVGDSLAETLRPEWVVEITGKVNERPNGMVNDKITTGTIEIEAIKLKILNEAKTPPFEVNEDSKGVNEEVRMKYRYIDLRTERMKNNLLMRHDVIKFIRNYMYGKDFIEIETPMLTKSTPEGARDFVVPSRLQPGSFYALPQSPQQYKQLLMVAGMEKYFQIVKCLRDEDQRGQRQAEFTQLDIEMSFVEQEDILNLVEELAIKMVKELFPEKKITQIPFPRLTYKESMEKYKSDKPDLRKDKKDPNELAFTFILDFPMFDESEGKGKWIATHHPFTKPQTTDIKIIKEDMKNVLAYQYDLALNGFEVAGGSIRTHDPKVLEAVFEALGHSKKEIQDKFGHLLKAFEYGVPPHGGIAWGLDRLLTIFANEPNIREVIAFPKTGDGRDLMMNAPSEITKEQLKELQLVVKKK